MYLETFKLQDLPFRLSPDPQFLYLSKAHARAKAYMESTIWFTDGFVVITGEIGAGKTTLIETFLRELEKDVVVAQINQTQVSSLEFLQSVLVQFGFSPFKMKKAEVLSTLNQFLIEQYSAGRKVLLIIDEAQNLSLKVLEEVRMLSGVETTRDKVLRIILAGQPELNDKLDAPELIQMAQRIRLRFHLPRLSPEDMKAYILHRLEVAGSHSRQIFLPDTFDLIHRYTGGTPRLVNTLCDTAMLAASNDDRDTVQQSDVREAIGELQWTDFASRRHMGVSQRAPAEPLVESSGIHSAASGGEALPASTGDFVRLADDTPRDPSETPVARILLVNSHTETSMEQPLYTGRLLIGRTAGNDLQIDSRFVSRHHCQILTTPDGSVIEDLNSTNGIFFKSKRVRFHHLNDGDVITIGQHEILYVDERAARRSADLGSTGDTTSGRLSPAHDKAQSTG
ncbi:MAG TPA: AAA family ATPase [Steroidobacteraceae bacterium]|nr:AAA family ATPase [Steroidobacteraceae bacterium]